MNNTCMKIVLLVIMIWGLVLSGCSPRQDVSPQITIEQPSEGALIEQGETISIVVKVSNSASVSSISLSINGIAHSQKNNQQNVDRQEFSWKAESTGLSSIQVFALDSAGQIQTTSLVIVNVIEKSPVDLPTPGFTATTAKTPTPAATVTPTTTPTLDPIVASTLEAGVNFSVDEEYLWEGECTMLRWDIKKADVVMLDGVPVEPLNAREVCPTETTSYTLTAITGSTQLEKVVDVYYDTLLEDDTSGPSIASLTHSPEFIWDKPACGKSDITIQVSTEDDSEILMALVDFRMINGNKQGEWQETIMDEIDPYHFKVTIAQEDLEMSLPVVGGGTVEYYVTVMDVLANETVSKSTSVTIKPCSSN